MPNFGNKSNEKLDSCHEDLQKVMNLAIKYIDFSVLEGTRTLEKQQEYYKKGQSKLDGVDRKSKHQSNPSLAIDICPYPISWSDARKNLARFYHLAGYIFMAYHVLQEEGELESSGLRYGGDWNSDKDFSDQIFDDLPHFEIIF